MAYIVPEEVIVQFGTLSTTKEKCIFMMILKSSWVLLACVTADCIKCYCLKSLYRWIPIQDSGIWEEEQQIDFFSVFFWGFGKHWNSQYLEDLSLQSIKRWIIC